MKPILNKEKVEIADENISVKFYYSKEDGYEITDLTKNGKPFVAPDWEFECAIIDILEKRRDEYIMSIAA